MSYVYGSTHPGLAPLLEGREPLCVERAVWPVGELELKAYLCPDLRPEVDLPDELVSSVRCIVGVGTKVVLCHSTLGDAFVWPGGRREPGETFHQTAVREVREETGWLLDECTLRTLGFLHFHHLTPAPEGHPYPHPDFLQLLLHGTATGAPVDWVDLEGFVVRSELVELSALDRYPLGLAERLIVAAAIEEESAG